MQMRISDRQKTIAHLCRVSGRGYWTGKNVTLTFLPAPVMTGIRFRRVDLPGSPEVAVTPSNRIEASLRTKLQSGGVVVEMIEHVMAALYAMGVDNCIIECDSQEMPGLDGSALRYALAIEQSGVVEQSARKNIFAVRESIRVDERDGWVELVPCHLPGLHCEYHLEYSHPSPIPQGRFAIEVGPSTFLAQVASARTFVTQTEASYLQSQGVAQHVTYQDLLVFNDQGPIDNTLRFDDECARHKLLDLIGDLAVCGFAIQGKVVAHRSGHNLNGRMAEKLQEIVHGRALAAA